jgi:hypothetical protein
MERLESVGEAVRANLNTTKRSKKNLQHPFRFSTENIHKNNQNQNKNKEIKPKIYTDMSLPREVK